MFKADNHMNLGLTHLRLAQLPRQEVQCVNKKRLKLIL